MNTRTERAFKIIRPVVMAAAFAVLALSPTQLVGAEQSAETSERNTHVQIAACELAGGDADVGQIMTANGYYATSVSCSGGLLDGMECGNTSQGSDCHWKEDEYVEFRNDKVEVISKAEVAIDEVKVAPEPTQPPIVIDEPVVIEPVVDAGEDAAEATAEPVDPTPEPIVDGGEVVDEIAPPIDGTDDGGKELPEINDTVVIDEIVAPEPEKGTDDGGRELSVDIKVTTDVIATDPVVAGP